MRRTASEVIRELEMRVARLERESGTLDLLKTKGMMAKEIVRDINRSGAFPHGITLGQPRKGSKGIWGGFIPINRGEDFVYEIIFQDDSGFKSPFKNKLNDLYDKPSFTLVIEGKEVATAKNGVMDSSFLSKLKRFRPY